MSKKLFLVFVAAMTLALTACEVKEKDSADFTKWRSSRITGRSAGEREIPTAYILDCRYVTEAQNVHYYYSVIADPSAKTVQNEDGDKETIYSKADLHIDYVSNSVDGHYGLDKGLVAVPVDFKIIEQSTGESIAIAVANENTVANFQSFYKDDPYFNHIQVGDEIMVLGHSSFASHSTNLTKVNLPGIVSGDSLECQ